MVMIYEYRIPLPFTMEEYEIAQLYMVAKFSASESSGDSGDGVEVLKNEPFEDRDRRGQYTHKMYHLASKLPSWLVSLLPKKALILEEEAWNAYPRCTTVLKCPFLSKFKLCVETNHVPDRATTENALNLDAKTVKKRQVEYIDIAMDQVETYVEEEDPGLFSSKKTGRGPLKEGWLKECEPVMCAYKCVTVDVPYWGIGSRIEKFIAKNAQRKILLEGHRKCFCWLDEWHGLTMEDVRKMEADTAETMRRARAAALKRLTQEGVDGEDTTENIENVDGDVVEDDYAKTGPLESREEVLSPTKANANGGTPNRSSRESSSRSLRRKPSMSLVGPSFTVGIATMSATDKEFIDSPKAGKSIGSAPPMPSPNEWDSTPNVTPQPADVPEPCTKNALPSPKSNLMRFGSSESFNGSHYGTLSWEMQQYNNMLLASHTDESAASNEVAKCVDVLDRAIGWAKGLSLKKNGLLGLKSTGTVTPLNEKTVSTPKSFLDQSTRQPVDVPMETSVSVKRRSSSKKA